MIQPLPEVPPRTVAPSQEPLRIHIDRDAGIGDGLLMVPALRALRADYPQATITYRGAAAAGTFLQHVGLVDGGMGMGYAKPTSADILIGFSFRPQEWRREHYRDARTVISCPWIGPAGTHQAVFQYQQVKRALPIWADYDPSPLPYPIPERLYEKYAGAIVLAAGTSTPAKAWPHFRALALELQRAGHRVVFLENCPQAEGFERFRGGFLPACAVIAASRLVIGNDSCAVHVAGLVGTPSIALFGPSIPAHWHPIGIGATVLHGCPSLQHRAHTNAVIACDKGDCWDLLPCDRVASIVASTLS